MNGFLLRVYYFIGIRTIIWYCLSIIAAFMISLIELGIASFLQFFLIALGVISTTAKSTGFLSSYTLSPIQIALFLLIIGVLKGLSQFIVGQGATIANESVKARLQLLNLFEMLQKEKLSFVSSGLTSYRISEVFPKSALFCAISSQLVALIVQCTGLTILLILTSWQLAFIGIAGLSFITLIVYFINLNVRRISVKTPREQIAVMSGIARVTRNWLFIRLKRTEKREYHKLTKNTLSYAMFSIRASFWSQFGSAIPPILGIFLIVGIILFTLYNSTNIGLGFISFLYLFIRFIQNLGTLAALFGEANSVFPQFKEAFQYVSKFSKNEIELATQKLNDISVFGKEKIKNNDSIIPNFNISNTKTNILPEIGIKNLYFTYDGNPIFNGLSLRIEPGSIFGIAGKSGAGKSTLLALILGMIEPSSGSICINNISPKEYFMSKSSKVGYVGAESFLIEGTIKENILYGWDGYSFSEEEIMESLSKAYLSDIIDKLPMKLEYELTENGEGLSAGQKQRLCIARALLGKPELLILDEASANLDNNTESEIAKTLHNLKQKATIIIVSHRIGLLNIADKKLILGDEDILLEDKGLVYDNNCFA